MDSKKNLKNSTISLVIPLFNEEDSLKELYQQTAAALKSVKSYELIFINDGSTDSSQQILEKIAKTDKRVKIIKFRRNKGKAAALNEGFKNSSKEIVITMDADLQDGPENITYLVERINQGFDLVVGWKKVRHDPAGKLIPSKAFNFFVRKISGIPLHDFNSGLKAMTKEVADEVYLYGELHRFIPVLAHQKGFKVTEVPVIHHSRKYGRSKYGWTRLFKGFLDFLTVLFLTRFGSTPLHLFGTAGAFSILLGIVFGIYLSALHFKGISIYRRPLLTLAMLLILAGLQLLSTGLLAEMIVSRFKGRDRNDNG